MLIVGDYLSIPNDIDNLVILNLSSFVEGYPNLNLFPSTDLDFFDDKEFDIRYANYIFSNEYLFCNFMSIIINLYNGFDVYILVNRSEVMDTLSESLMKLIQQRYGYNYQFINNVQDFNRYDDSDFSMEGLGNLDMDKDRFTMIVAMQNPNSVTQNGEYNGEYNQRI